MKKRIKKKAFLVGGTVIFFMGFLVLLFFDAFYGGSHFRTMQDKITSSENVDLAGLREIQASAGNAPRFADLQRRLGNIKKKKIIVDAMCEFHGYIKGVPTNLLGYHLPTPGFRHILRRIILTGTIKKRPDLVISEAEEAKKYGFDYKNVNIGSKFTATNQHIDEIVSFFDHLPENTWLHIHCINSKGRTSMVLAMLDILKNAPRISLYDIIKRQHLLGAVDLYNTAVWKKGTYNKKQLEKRKAFIQEFYEFVCQRKEGGLQRWSEWHNCQIKRGL